MIIEEYNEQWIEHFCLIKEILVKNVSKIISIEHIGSTAIMGMYAKPIIDIDIVINTPMDFGIVKKELELIGYAHNGDQGIAGREAFKRNGIIFNAILDKIKHHLYVCEKNNDELKKHILFRNHLNKHKEKVHEYNSIKMNILEKYGKDNREKYVEVKETEYTWFFEGVINQEKMELRSLRGLA